jgi:cobalamin biosynthesis protein CbiG
VGIEKRARADVEALARGIIEELRAAGLEIRRTDTIAIRNSRR